MGKWLKNGLMVVMGVLAVLAVVPMAPEPVSALSAEDCKNNPDTEGCANTSILPSEWGGKDGIGSMLKFVVSVMMYGLGAIAIIGTTIAGILYLTARDNEQQVAKAKMRLFEIAIGLLAWAVLFTLLNWLVPGGITDLFG